MESAIVLSYKLKLFPTQAKADTLACLTQLFRRLHADSTNQLAAMEELRFPSCKGKGAFAGRATRRAFIDYSRCLSAHHTQVKIATKKAYTSCLRSLNDGKNPKRVKKEHKALAQAVAQQVADQWQSKFKPPFLKAELIDAAQVQTPVKARNFDCWIMIRGTTVTQGGHGAFYVPAKKHRAINRTLSLPGAALCKQGEVFRKNGKWYVRVGVKVPLPDEQPANGWIGVDVGLRRSITCSDGYQGPDLRPIIAKQKTRQADRQRHLHLADFGLMTPQRLAQAKEARALVSRAHKSGRGIALESPDRLPSWKQWAARFLGIRVLLLAALAGVPVSLVSPSYTSLTCSRCGEVGQTFRKKTMFRCHRCGFTANADYNAACNIASRASRISCESRHGSLSLYPLAEVKTSELQGRRIR